MMHTFLLGYFWLSKMYLPSQIKITHSKFIVSFTGLLFLIANTINYNKTAQWFVIQGSLDSLGLLAFFTLTFSFTLAFFTLFAHKYTTKLLAVLFIILSTMATYFIAKYNVAVEETMVVNTLHTDLVEVLGLLSTSMIPYALILIILPLLVLTRIKIIYHSFWRNLIQSISLFVLALVVFFGSFYLKNGSIINAINASNQYVFHTSVPVNLITSIYDVIADSLSPYFADDAPKPIVITGEVTSEEDLIVVLVVGEAARQKNLSLYGYEGNDTTPKLAAYKDMHLLNGIAKYGSTIYALPQILEKNDVKLVNITSSLGIKTNCFVNFTLYDNCNPIGETHVDNCGHGGRCYDEDVLPLLNEALAKYQSGYRFIVLHFGGGSHGPIYQKRYPEEYQIFKPQCLDANVLDKCTQQELYNSYDNSILYLDTLLDNVLKSLDRSNKPYVMIYISDHGESLMEDGRIFHGMPLGLSLPDEQAQVPLLVRASRPITIIERDEYKQQDIFDTILTLFNIKTPLVSTQDAFIRKTNE